MKSIENRIWCGDFEIVNEDNKPYTKLFTALSAMLENDSIISDIKETWNRNGDEIDIKISYLSGDKTYNIRTKRSGDYFNMDVLFLLNTQIKFPGYKFEGSYTKECIYFINDSEKIKLENEGIVFEEQNFLQQFEFIAYNVAHSLKESAEEFTFYLVNELNDHIEAYYNIMSQKRSYKNMQDTIRLNILEKIDWKRAAESGLRTDNLYKFVNMNT